VIRLLFQEATPNPFQLQFPAGRESFVQTSATQAIAKKTTWPNTRRYPTTSVYSLTGPRRSRVALHLVIRRLQLLDGAAFKVTTATHRRRNSTPRGGEDKGGRTVLCFGMTKPTGPATRPSVAAWFPARRRTATLETRQHFSPTRVARRIRPISQEVTFAATCRDVRWPVRDLAVPAARRYIGEGLGSSCDELAQCANAGSPTNGFLEPDPTAGEAAGTAITADLVSATAVLTTTFTASSIDL